MLHHYVPQFYLKRFSPMAGTRRICVTERGTGKTYTAPVAKIAAQQDYYAVPEGEHDIEENALEVVFGDIETKAAPLFNYLIRNGELPEDKRIRFSEYMAIQCVRTPSFRQRYAEGMMGIMSFMARAEIANGDGWERHKEAMKNRGIDLPDDAKETMLSFLDRGERRINVAQMATLPAIGQAHHLVPIFNAMNWSVACIVDGRDEFVTSDNPLYWSSPTDSHNPVYGDGGLQNSAVELILPLGPKNILLAGWKERGPLLEADDGFIKEINSRTIFFAHKQVYSRSPSEVTVETAKRFNGPSRRMNFNGKTQDIRVVRKLKARDG